MNRSVRFLGKLLAVLLCGMLVLSAVCTFALAANWTGEFSGKVMKSEGDGTTVVRFAFNNITHPKGIVGASFLFYYDPQEVEIVKWSVNHPDSWKFVESGASASGAEDWTMLDRDSEGNSFFMYLIMHDDENAFISKNGVFYVDVTFRAKNASTKSVKLNVQEIYMTDPTLMDTAELENQTFEVDFKTVVNDTSWVEDPSNTTYPSNDPDPGIDDPAYDPSKPANQDPNTTPGAESTNEISSDYSTNENEGAVGKILIAVIAIVAVAGAAVATTCIIRKRK